MAVDGTCSPDVVECYPTTIDMFHVDLESRGHPGGAPYRTTVIAAARWLSLVAVEPVVRDSEGLPSPVSD